MKMYDKHEMCKDQDRGSLYKIGTFAAMNHVTVKALRFYEEKGLLMPAYIDAENGYRYYRLSQMAVMQQISALKQAGFTLEEINCINNGEDEEALLLNKKAELLSQIAELTRQAAVLDGYLAKRKYCLSAPVLIKEIPECKVASMQIRLHSYDDLFDQMPLMGEMMEQAGCVCAMPEYCFTEYLESNQSEEDILVELCEAVTECKVDMEGLHFRTIPKVLVASIFHKGSYDTLSSSYEIAMRYVEENGYEIAGPIRESYIDGVWNKEDESQWLSEIQIPIRKKTQE